jgi:hypothetical protein
MWLAASTVRSVLGTLGRRSAGMSSMYLVKNGEQLLASCHTHELAFEFFMTYGGFFEKDLHIEKEYV